MDEWEQAGQELDARPPEAKDAVVHDRRGLTVLVRNALFRRVRLAAADDHEALGEADVDNGFSAHKWRTALDEYYDVHEDVLVDADALVGF